MHFKSHTIMPASHHNLGERSGFSSRRDLAFVFKGLEELTITQ